MMSLEEKRQETEAIFAEAAATAPLDRIAVAWTGGKDSTLLLWLWRQWLIDNGRARPEEVRALSVDTGLKFPETIAFREDMARRWQVAVHVFRPQTDLESYPVAEDVVQCCRDLKIAPLQEGLRALDIAVLLTGLRRDEHPSRSQRAAKEACDRPSHLRVHPLLAWTEMDVWAMHIQTGIPYCSLYDHGYRSLGCQPCTRCDSGAERAGRNQDKEGQLDTLRSLGYF